MKAPEESIHPRVVNGRTVHPKKNTAHAPKKTSKAQKALHVRQNVWDRTKLAGTKRPGSNNK